MDDAGSDERGWRKTANQGADHLMGKLVAVEKARTGLRHTVVHPRVTKRNKESVAWSKRARDGSLAIADYPQLARICILQAFLFADAILPFSGVITVFFFPCLLLVLVS